MSDLLCPRCAEPWDTDTMHDVASTFGLEFDEAVHAFALLGCSVIYATDETTNPPLDSIRPSCEQTADPLIRETFAMLMPDVDGIASELELIQGLS